MCMGFFSSNSKNCHACMGIIQNVMYSPRTLDKIIFSITKYYSFCVTFVPFIQKIMTWQPTDQPTNRKHEGS